MAIGERIRFIRMLKGMTQKFLGMRVGLPEKTADIRIAQYESGTRTPKEYMINQIAFALDVSPEALTVPDIDTYKGLIHTFFAIEDRYALQIDKLDDTVCLHFDIRDFSEQAEALRLWYAESVKLKNGEITKEEYDHWRYTYPRVEAERFRAKQDELRRQKKASDSDRKPI